MKIVVLDGYTLVRDDIAWTELERLGELVVWPRSASSEVEKHSAGAQVLLTNKTPVTADLIQRSPDLQFISVLATGYNIVDTSAARARGIPVSNVPAYGTDTVAQHVFALILELTNHVGKYARSTQAGDWSRSPDWTYSTSPTHDLASLTLGVLGFGRIGQRVGHLGDAFGMRVFYSSSTPNANVPYPAELVSRQQLFERADVLSLHCTLTSETVGLVNRDLLDRMKESAFLINTARGQLIHEPDLAEALRRGALAGAAVDVLSSEPPPPDHPLLTLPNCLVTPHIAWGSLAARRRIMATTIANVEAFVAREPVHVVNP
jgi:glycerate dehydrogenase